MFYRILLLSGALLSHAVYAVDTIEVQALMPGMVVLAIDGERTTLKSGDVSTHGVKMISSDTKSAVLEINGQQKKYTMGTTVSTSFTKREVITEQVIVDNYGMFRSHGSINGQSIRFLIDTGATSVAMSARHARQLGIQYRLNGKPVKTHTASGIANAWALNLQSVRLGQLLEKNVQGVVIEGDHPRHVLLGMSFLSRMKVEKEGNKMKISKKN